MRILPPPDTNLSSMRRFSDSGCIYSAHFRRRCRSPPPKSNPYHFRIILVVTHRFFSSISISCSKKDAAANAKPCSTFLSSYTRIGGHDFAPQTSAKCTRGSKLEVSRSGSGLGLGVRVRVTECICVGWLQAREGCGCGCACACVLVCVCIGVRVHLGVSVHLVWVSIWV